MSGEVKHTKGPDLAGFIQVMRRQWAPDNKKIHLQQIGWTYIQVIHIVLFGDNWIITANGETEDSVESVIHVKDEIVRAISKAKGEG